MESMLVHVVNAAIVERAKDLGLKQADIARQLGVRPQAVNKWWLGENTPERDRWPDIEDVLEFERGHLERLNLTATPAEPTRVDVIAAIRADPLLDDRGRELVIATYRIAVDQSAAIARARSLKRPAAKATKRRS